MSRWNTKLKLKLYTLMTISALTMVLVVVVSAAVTMFGLDRIERNVERGRFGMESQVESLNAKYHIVQVQQFITDAALTGAQESIDEASEHLKSLEKSLDRIVAVDPSAKEMGEQVRISGQQLYEVGLEMTKAYWNNGKQAGNAIMQREGNGLDAMSAALSKKMDTLAEAEALRTEEYQSAIFSSQRRLMWMTLIVGGINILILTLLVFVLRNSLIHVRDVSDSLISDSSKLKGSVRRILAISQDLSFATAEQSAAVSTTSGAIEEISSMIKMTADNARDSSAATQQSKVSAERGMEVVKEMVRAVHEIGGCNSDLVSAIESSNAKIEEILGVIQEIGEKTKVINDIVFQTKLLSFNASVEAARAGEQGKGFAVVAEEVGNLAQMSGAASHQISELLNASIQRVEGIVKETRSAVERLARTAREAVDRGNEVAEDCQVVLADVVTRVTAVTDMVENISNASREQSAGVNEVLQAIHTINRSISVGAAATSKSSQAADELAARAQSLNESSDELRTVLDGRVTVSRFMWDDEYVLHIPQMDDQHKEIVKRMNGLAEHAMNYGFDHVKIPQLMRDLVEYTGFHFAEEENYMRSITYPGLEKHKQDHQAMLAKFAEYERRAQGGACQGPELINFLSDWLIRHFLTCDKEYSRYVHRNDSTDKNSKMRAA